MRVVLQRRICAGVVLAFLATSTIVSAATELAMVQPESLRADKVSPRPEPGSFVPGELLVSYDRQLTQRDKQAVSASYRATLGKFLSTSISTRDPLVRHLMFDPSIDALSVIDELENTPGIASVEVNQYRELRSTPDDPSFSNSGMWGLKSFPGSNAIGAWANGQTGSSDVIVAVLDSGTQIGHPDLAANIWSNPGEIAANGIDDDGNGYVDDVNGWDFLYDDNQVFDSALEDYHGTHVSGTIGAVGDNSTGVVGVNWNVSILPVKFLGDTSTTVAKELQALDYILDLKDAGHNIVAVNNSWGCDGASCYSQLEQDKIDEFGAAGMLFVVAAGNDGRDNDIDPSYPASYVCDGNGTRDWDCIISVTAHNLSGGIPDWSGISEPGGPHVGASVDISAPGVSIYSTYPSDTYGALSGTSMATPHVTGAIALCTSINSGILPQAIRAALIASSRSSEAKARLLNDGDMLDVSVLASLCAASPAAPSGVPVVSVNETFTNGHMSVVVDTTNVQSGNVIEVQIAERSENGCSSTTRWRYERVDQSQTIVDVALLATESAYCIRARVLDVASSSFTEWSEQIIWTTRPGYRCVATTYDGTLMSTGKLGVDLSLVDDDVSDAITVDTAFYGTPVATRSLHVASNGYFSLGDVNRTDLATGTWIHDLPYRGDIWPEGLIAPWFADLNPDDGGAVRHAATADRTIVTWDDVPHFTTTPGAAAITGTSVTFQLIIEHDTGSVIVQYEDATITTAYLGSVEATFGSNAITAPDNTAHVALPSYGEISDNSAMRCTWVDPADTAIVISDVGVHGAVTGVSGVGQCVTNCATFVDIGDQVVLTATPNDGYKIAGWDGPCSGTSLTCIFTATSNAIVSVTFEEESVAPVVPPSAPRSVTGVSGDGAVTVSWLAPIDDGGSPVTGYVASTSTGESCSWSSGPLSCVVSGLTNGTSYSFTVSATNSAGTGDESVASVPVVPFRVPGVPSGVVVSSDGDSQVSVSWVAPVESGDPLVSSYTATASPGGSSCTTPGLSCTIFGLTNGVEYSVTVAATNGFGASSPSVAVTGTPDGSGAFVALTPSRVLDTRSGDRVGSLAVAGGGVPYVLQVTGQGGVPSGGVSAVALNVTAVSTEANDFGGFVTVYPCGVVPDVSNLNFVSGQTIPNSVIAPVSDDGEVCFYVYGKTHLLADVSGYFPSGFEALTPKRLLDTRPSGVKVGSLAVAGGGVPYVLQVTGQGGVPSGGVSAVALNVTAVETQTNDYGGFLSVYPCGVVPDVSNLNFVSGQTIPNSVIAPVSDDGEVCFYVYGKTHLLADVSGYFPE